MFYLRFHSFRVVLWCTVHSSERVNILPLFSLFQGCQAGSNIWLSYWSTSQTITTTVANFTAAAAANITHTAASVEEEGFDRLQFLFIYGAFGVGQVECLSEIVKNSM